MFKIKISILFLFLLAACYKEKPISFGSYQAISCEETNKNFKEYVFDRDSGYLYFYSLQKDSFIPLNLRKESGFFTEDDIPEVFSSINKNKLLITEIDYGSKFKGGYFKVNRIINLKTLRQKSFYKNEKNNLVTKKFSCNWIDPKLGIKKE